VSRMSEALIKPLSWLQVSLGIDQIADTSGSWATEVLKYLL